MIVMLIYRLTKQHVDLYVNVYIIYIIHIILHNIIYIHVLIGMCMLEWNVRIMYTILWFNGSNLLFETISEMMFHPFYLLALLKK